MKKPPPTKSKSIPFSCRWVLSTLWGLVISSVFLSTTYSAAFQESFDTDEATNSQETGRGGPINRWILETTEPTGHVIVRGTRIDPSAPLPIIGKGSLEYSDAEGKIYPSKGNRLQHTDEELINLTVGYSLDLKNSSLVGGSVEADSSSDVVPSATSRLGWGAPNSTLWFSAIIRPNFGLLEISLRNSAYSTGPNGLLFRFTPKNGDFSVRQNWNVLRESELQASLLIQQSETTWLVAKIETGPKWGNSEAYASINIGNHPGEVTLPEPTGRLTVWINPLIGKEPAPATAAATFPLHEMRFDSLWVVVETSAEVDEIRIDPEFSAITAP